MANLQLHLLCKDVIFLGNIFLVIIFDTTTSFFPCHQFSQHQSFMQCQSIMQHHLFLRVMFYATPSFFSMIIFSVASFVQLYYATTSSSHCHLLCNTIFFLDDNFFTVTFCATLLRNNIFFSGSSFMQHHLFQSHILCNSQLLG